MTNNVQPRRVNNQKLSSNFGLMDVHIFLFLFFGSLPCKSIHNCQQRRWRRQDTPSPQILSFTPRAYSFGGWKKNNLTAHFSYFIILLCEVVSFKCNREKTFTYRKIIGQCFRSIYAMMSYFAVPIYIVSISLSAFYRCFSIGIQYFWSRLF